MYHEHILTHRKDPKVIDIWFEKLHYPDFFSKNNAMAKENIQLK